MKPCETPEPLTECLNLGGLLAAEAALQRENSPEPGEHVLKDYSLDNVGLFTMV